MAFLLLHNYTDFIRKGVLFEYISYNYCTWCDLFDRNEQNIKIMIDSMNVYLMDNIQIKKSVAGNEIERKYYI